MSTTQTTIRGGAISGLFAAFAVVFMLPFNTEVWAEPSIEFDVKLNSPARRGNGCYPNEAMHWHWDREIAPYTPGFTEDNTDRVMFIRLAENEFVIAWSDGFKPIEWKQGLIGTWELRTNEGTWEVFGPRFNYSEATWWPEKADGLQTMEDRDCDLTRIELVRIGEYPNRPEEPEPTDPDTPEPEPPTEPETPDPVTPGCTYKHRIIGIPGTTSAGYTGQILISSEDSNATANIRAYQFDNGHPIDVLNSEGSAIGSTTSLAPAHSVKTFRLEGARGWHSVIVEHPSARAMRRATVVMRLREPDVGVSFMPADRVEDCATAGTNTE